MFSIIHRFIIFDGKSKSFVVSINVGLPSSYRHLQTNKLLLELEPLHWFENNNNQLLRGCEQQQLGVKSAEWSRSTCRCPVFLQALFAVQAVEI
jgi:hypothetical protein